MGFLIPNFEAFHQNIWLSGNLVFFKSDIFIWLYKPFLQYCNFFQYRIWYKRHWHMKMCVHFFLRQTREWLWYTLAVVVGLEPTILFYQKQQLFLFHEKRKKQFDWNIFLQCIEKKGSCQSKSSYKAATTIAWFVNIL